MALELVLTKSDEITMDGLQQDLLEKNKLARKAKERLETFVKNHTIDIFKPGREVNILITRDIDTVKNLLKLNPEGLTTFQICDALNHMIRKEDRRWKVDLDSGMFHSFLGIYLKKDSKISKDLTKWKIKI